MTIGALAQPGSYVPVQDLAGSGLLVVRESSASFASRPRLLDRVREPLRTHHYSRRTEKAYVGWIRRYIRDHASRSHQARPGVSPQACACPAPGYSDGGRPRPCESTSKPSGDSNGLGYPHTRTAIFRYPCTHCDIEISWSGESNIPVPSN
jgi:integrase-like protein